MSYLKFIQKYPKRKAISLLKEKKKGTFYKNRDKNIFITGLPRGGTTWIAEIFCQIKNATLIWEPFHHKYLRQRFDHQTADDIGRIPYVPNGEKYSLLDKYLDSLLNGQEIDPGNLQRTSLKNFLKGKFCVIKCCKGNLLLPYITKYFDIKKPVHIVRHPCAVISSQLRHGGFKGMSKKALFQANKFTDFKEYRHIIEKIDSHEKLLAVFWCVMNAPLLKKEVLNRDWVTLFYEDIITQPENELKRIENELNIEFPEEVTHKLTAPSSTTKEDSAILRGGNQLESWKRHLTDKQQGEIFGVLKEFGVEVYRESAVPYIS